MKRLLTNMRIEDKAVVLHAIAATGRHDISWNDQPSGKMSAVMAPDYGSVWLSWHGDEAPDCSNFWTEFDAEKERRP